MIIKFTKASKKDGVLVTVTVAQLDIINGNISYFTRGDELRIVVDGVPTLFRINRLNKDGSPTTAVSKCFPRYLKLPLVGQPVYANVTEVTLSTLR